MKISNYLPGLRKKVDLAIVDNLAGSQNGLLPVMRYAVFSGGKRLRPIIFLVTLESLGGKMNNTALRVASSLEFIHAFSLIQDDLPSMDNDDYRRGKLTVHKVFGADMAILASDALLNRAYNLIIEDSRLKQQLKIKIISELTASVSKLISGQQKDLKLIKKRKVILVELNDIYSDKTGRLVTACLRIAGILKGVSSSQLKRLSSFGRKLGLAYQISDDILNITGNKRAFRGRLFSDKKRGKITYPDLLGIRKSQAVSTNLIKAAKEDIGKINMDKEKLFGLCDFILKRTY